MKTRLSILGLAIALGSFTLPMAVLAQNHDHSSMSMSSQAEQTQDYVCPMHPEGGRSYSINAWDQPASPAPGTSGPPTTAVGISPTAELIDRYAEKTGADLSRLQFYRAFNSFKTACILHGVYARYRMGQKSTEGVDMQGLFDRMVGAITTCAAAAEAEGI